MGALLQDESVPQVYVAVEWLQDADVEGEEAKELETPSKPATVRTPSWQTVPRLCQSLSFTHSSTCTVVCRPRRSSMTGQKLPRSSHCLCMAKKFSESCRKGRLRLVSLCSW